MADSNSASNADSKAKPGRNDAPVIARLNSVLSDLGKDVPKLASWPASNDYVTKLGTEMDRLLFAAWKLGKCDEKDARFYSLIPTVLATGDEMLVDVFLDAKPRHRNRT